MNVRARPARFGFVAVAAIVLAASLVYVAHLPKPAPTLADNPLSAPTSQPLSTGANILNATAIPQPSSACGSTLPGNGGLHLIEKNSNDSSQICFTASEFYSPYWQPLVEDFIAYYSIGTRDTGSIDTSTSTYTVYFGDGTTGTLSDHDVGCTDSLDQPCYANFRTKHKYNAPGEYKVSLYKDGKSIIDQLNITIATPSDVCKLDNVLIPEGSGLTAYNDTCDSEPRQCTNGVLSGSYKYVRCPPAAR